MNQLAGVQSIAVEHRITQGFAKGEFDELLDSQNTARYSYQAHEPGHLEEYFETSVRAKEFKGMAKKS